MQLSLPNKELNSMKFKHRLWRPACIIVLLSHVEVPSFVSLPQATSDLTRASRIRNKGGLCGVKQLQLVSASLGIYPKDMNWLNYYDLHRADK